jgi:peptidoglycan/xylan/chitin deacetylase (PgdA/CDA1 family)
MNLLFGSIAVASVVTCAVPQVIKQAGIRRLRETCRRERMLVLTYDDGPSADLTPAILDILDHFAARATFFMLGSKAASVPSVVERMSAAGHELGCHSQNHLNAWKTWPWTAVDDINQGYESLSPWLARDSAFRPPYGKVTPWTLMSLQRRGAATAWWTVDSGDTHRALPEPQSVTDEVARAHGGVVLLHDFDRAAERGRFVLQVTESLLRMAQSEGLKVCCYRDLGQQHPHPTAPIEP